MVGTGFHAEVATEYFYVSARGCLKLLPSDKELDFVLFVGSSPMRMNWVFSGESDMLMLWRMDLSV